MSFWEWAATATSPAYSFYKWASSFYSGDDDDDGSSGGLGGGSTRGGGAGRKGYKNYVSSLPVNGYSSDGGLLFYPSLSDIEVRAGGSFYFLSPRPSFGSLDVFSFPADSSTYTYNGLSFTRGVDGRSMVVHSTTSSSFGVRYLGMYSTTKFRAPISGNYRRLSGLACSFVGFTSEGEYKYLSWSFPENSFVHCAAGNYFSIGSSSYKELDQTLDVISLNGNIYLPTYKIMPDVPSDIDSSLYGPSTRINVYNIVNETTNVYTNPVTGEEKQITNWNYNYDNRSYELHLADGMTVNVEFGDLNINIDEISFGEDGSTTTNNYTTYYTIDNSGGSDPDVSPSPSTPDNSVSSSGPSRVFQNYGNKITQHYGNEGHNGVDVIPTSGVADTVIAHSEGEVVAAVSGLGNDTSSTGVASWGNYVKIKHPNGYYTLYAHLASVSVKEGDYVYTGQPIGLMGDSGRAFGAHLHFEVYKEETTRINPEPYLNSDLPGLATEADGWAWWRSAWTDFRAWLSGIVDKTGQTGSDVFEPGVDSSTGEDGEDESWSFLDLLTGVVKGVWKIIKGIPGVVFGGLFSMIGSFLNIGDFFDAFDSNNPDGVFNVLTQGSGEVWD